MIPLISCQVILLHRHWNETKNGVPRSHTFFVFITKRLNFFRSSSYCFFSMFAPGCFRISNLISNETGLTSQNDVTQRSDLNGTQKRLFFV